MVSVESFNPSGLQAKFTHGFTVSAQSSFTYLTPWYPSNPSIRILEKEREQIHHYQDLKVEIRKMWNCKSVSVVLVVVLSTRGSDQKLVYVGYLDCNTWDLELTPERILVGTLLVVGDMNDNKT